MATVTYNLNNTHLEFELYPIDTNFKSVAAVYLFLKQNSGTWNTIYVGETSDINVRLNTSLKNHNAWPCASRHGVTHFGILQTNGTDQARIDLETALRHALSAPCNKQ